MGSGNFAIGEDLKLNGFQEYVQPILQKYKVEITNIMSYSENGRKKVLVSLTGGEGNQFALENAVQISLDEAKPISQKNFDELNKSSHLEELTAWPHQLREFKTIGLYQDNETASKVFQSLAIEYSTKNISYVLDKAKSEIKSFGERFKNF